MCTAVQIKNTVSPILSFLRFCHKMVGNLSTHVPTKFWGKIGSNKKVAPFEILSVKTRQNTVKCRTVIYPESMCYFYALKPGEITGK